MKKKVLIVFILALFVLGQNLSFGEEKNSIILGITPWGGDKEDMITKFKPLVDYLSDKIGKKVVFTTTDDYDMLINDVNNGIIDMGIFSPAVYVEAKVKIPNLKYLCTVVDKKTGLPSYYTGIFVRKDSGIKSYRDLKDKNIAFVDEKSASGYEFPVALMISKWKINPETFFKNSFFLGNHNNVIQAVYEGKFDAGTSGGLSMANKIKEYGNDPFLFIDKIEEIPYDAVAVSSEVDDVTMQKLREAFLGIQKTTSSKDGKNIIDSLPWGGFVVKKDSFYDVVRETKKLIKEYNMSKQGKRE